MQKAAATISNQVTWKHKSKNKENRMKAIKLFVLMALLACGASAQQTLQTSSPLHRVGGAYYSTAYNTWAARVVTGSASGSGITLVVAPALVTLQDGYTFSPWATTAALTIDTGTAQET